MTTTHVDPEYERWYRKYPRFPGVVKCIELLRSSNVHGAWIDVICDELENHAAEQEGIGFKWRPNAAEERGERERLHFRRFNR